MGRKRKISTEAQERIREDVSSTYKGLAEEFGVSLQTIYNIKKGKGAYAQSILALGGQPVLNAHGEVINVVVPPEDDPTEVVV